MTTLRLTLCAIVLAAALWLDPLWLTVVAPMLFMPVFAVNTCSGACSGSVPSSVQVVLSGITNFSCAGTVCADLNATWVLPFTASNVDGLTGCHYDIDTTFSAACWGLSGSTVHISASFSISGSTARVFVHVYATNGSTIVNIVPFSYTAAAPIACDGFSSFSVPWSGNPIGVGGCLGSSGSTTCLLTSL